MFEHVKEGIGSVYGNRQTEENQKRSIRNTKRMQQADMDFQRDMRGTMYQDMVKDLRAAGLNPILGYNKQGVGGSAAASAASAQGIGSGGGSSSFNPTDIFSAKLQHEQSKTQRNQQELIDAQKMKTEFESSSAYSKALMDNIEAQFAKNNPALYLLKQGGFTGDGVAKTITGLFSGAAKGIRGLLKKPTPPKTKTTTRSGVSGGKRVDYTETVTQ